jgi:hypothetical protein
MRQWRDWLEAHPLVAARLRAAKGTRDFDKIETELKIVASGCPSLSRRSPRSAKRSAPVDEKTIHVSVYEWLCLVLPGALIWHVPNGGKREPREAAKLKKMGVVPGATDLMILAAGYPLLCLEIKTQAGRLTADQHDFHLRVRKNGGKVSTVRGIDEARAALKSWGVFTRESAFGRLPWEAIDL